MDIPARPANGPMQPEYDDIKRMVDFFTTKGIEYWKMSSHNPLITHRHTRLLPGGNRPPVRDLRRQRRQLLRESRRGQVPCLSGTTREPGAKQTWAHSPRPADRASYTLPDSTNDWVVYLAPAAVHWTGAASTTWSTATGSGNWKKTSDNSAADYANGVAVIFDDTATGLTADISAADVSPSSVVFNNSTKNFTVTGTKGIAGATGILKQGTGKVTLSSVNSYTGVTTVDGLGGTLQLNGVTKAQAPVLTGGGANIKAGKMVFDYTGEGSPAATIKGLLTTSYHAGAWDTGKFKSSTADGNKGLGWVDNTATSQVTRGLDVVRRRHGQTAKWTFPTWPRWVRIGMPPARFGRKATSTTTGRWTFRTWRRWVRIGTRALLVSAWRWTPRRWCRSLERWHCSALD